MKTFLFILISIFAMSFAQAEFKISKNTKCKISTRPQDAKFSVHWHGPCVDGFADGLGVARYLNGSKVELLFYGKMKAGSWDIGVLDIKGGYMAGGFEKNEIQASRNADDMEQRKVTIQAFDWASKAALQLSQEFEKTGNKASAKHYKAESEKLSQQMD